ncbi:hypothetical protein O6H91_16G047800 [Diphasiastrum complanatum]|uniref:Uncharacterized protein n=1 Tax=Diphasiastrum complanatum TaxID=34168 RepID=A0ACC2BC37_DIPCM|nr:hypothetical protein O6H91_16G047800 [Diphasiastrum complanatum]
MQERREAIKKLGSKEAGSIGMAMGIRKRRALIWAAALLLFFLLMLITPRIPQDESYHDFADQRQFFGIPNALDVISNFPFLVIGIIGLVLCLKKKYFSLRGEVWGWAFFFIGIAATAFGSSYYHLHPTDARLVWDRLPMTVAFASIMAVFIIERFDEWTGTVSILPLLAAGVISVAYWRYADDLRPYALVQFVPCIAIPAMAIVLPPKYTHSSFWLWAAGCYLLAKVMEALDKQIFTWTGQVVSGHTLKHLSAAMVPVFTMIMVVRRSEALERVSMLQRFKVHMKGATYEGPSDLVEPKQRVHEVEEFESLLQT